MLRKKMRGGNTSMDGLTRGMRRLRVSPMGVRPQTRSVGTNTACDEQMSKLNEMADRISKMGLGETPEPTVDPPASDSEQSLEKGETPMISTLLLMTNDDNRPVSIRAVLDSSGRNHFLTERCRRRLNLPLAESATAVGELGEKILGKTVVKFSLYFNNTRVFEIDAFVTERIHARTPGVKPSPGEQLDFLTKASPNFYFPSSVDLLIGTQTFPILVENGPGYCIDENRSAMQSSLGWVMVGRVPASEYDLNIERKPESDEKPTESSEKPAETKEIPSNDKQTETRRRREQSFRNVFSPDYFESM